MDFKSLYLFFDGNLCGYGFRGLFFIYRLVINSLQKNHQVYNYEFQSLWG